MTDLRLAARAVELEKVLAAVAFSAGDEALDVEAGMTAAMDLLTGAKRDDHAVYVIGNGGSAAVAAHIVNDLVNVGRLRAHTLHDASLFSCMANDYGYENAFARMLSVMAREGDVLIAVSSSGNSPNIRNAAAAARGNGASVFTLSGFKPDNPLRGMGDVNLWVGAEDYGIVEMAHLFVLHTLADRFR